MEQAETVHVKRAFRKRLGKMSKAEFIMQHPTDMPAKEIVAKAKVKGMELDEKYIYATRSLHRNYATRSLHRKKTAVFVAVTNLDAEKALFMLAGEVGFTRALEILNAERERTLATIGRMV